MNKKPFVVVLFFLFLCMNVRQAMALVLVDVPLPPANNVGVLLDENTFQARKFTLNQTFSITSIEGWLTGWEVSDYLIFRPGTVTAAIYSDAGLIPNASDELFAQQFAVSLLSYPDADWFGLTGLNVTLNPGSYWAAFEVRSGDTYSGTFPIHQPGGPQPDYATFFNNQWQGGYTNYPAWRISGEPIGQTTTVPEPATIFLLSLSGFLAFFRRKSA